MTERITEAEIAAQRSEALPDRKAMSVVSPEGGEAGEVSFDHDSGDSAVLDADVAEDGRLVDADLITEDEGEAVLDADVAEDGRLVDADLVTEGEGEAVLDADVAEEDGQLVDVDLLTDGEESGR